MDFDFTPEQVMLRGLARELLTEHSSTRAVRKLLEDPIGYSEAVWQGLAEVGLLGLAIDEACGGQGLGMVELALVLEEMGRAVYPGPYFATVVLAATTIAAAGDRAQMAAYLPDIAGGKRKATLALLEDGATVAPEGVTLRARPQGGGHVLDGIKRFVPFAQAADLLLVAARTTDASDPTRGITIFALDRDAKGLSSTPNVGIDQTSRTATLTLKGVRAGPEAVIGSVDEGWPLVEAALRRAAVGAAAEMLGASRKAFEMTVEYARVRHQFGQPIGMFQVVKHACADMLLEVENAHAATYFAAWSLDTAVPEAAMAASVAKSYVGEASRKVCGAAIQVHGGIGYTWDYDLHLYFKRAKHLEALYGDGDTHRELVLREVLTPTAVPVLV